MRLFLLAPLVLTLGLSGCVTPKAPKAEDDFKTYCAACHGPAGKGNGGWAKELASQPADLTALSAGNGGVFPGTRVMAKIWGNAKGADSHAVMPEFASLMESELVPYDGGDGIMSPTPLRLVQLAGYLKTLQP